MIRIESIDREIWIAEGKSSKGKEELLKIASELGTKKKTTIQILDAEKIFSIDQICSAFEKAARAIENKENASNSLATETMLYVSGCRQIQEALNLIGLKNESKAIVILSEVKLSDLNSTFAFEEDSSILSLGNKEIRSFGITDLEISTVQEGKRCDLVLERVASVDIKKK